MTHCPRCGKENPAEIHTCTPLALKLADALENGTYLLWVERDATAAELRRLHEENEALRGMSFDTKRSPADEALLRRALEMLNDNHHYVADNEKHTYVMAHLAVIEALHERLAGDNLTPTANLTRKSQR